MGRFFSIDNVIFRGISRLGDMLLLSLMTVLLCVPVVTAGAALTALFDVSIKILRGRDTGTIKNFFVSFKNNFIQSTVIWLIYLPLGIGLYCLGYFAVNNITDDMLRLGVGGICLGAVIVYAFSFLFVFPVQAVFDNKIKDTVRTAFLMSFKHWPTSAVLLVAVAAIVYLCWLVPFIAYVMLVFGVGLFGMIFSTRFLTIFRKYNDSLCPDPEELKYNPVMPKEKAERAKRAEAAAVKGSGKVIR